MELLEGGDFELEFVVKGFWGCEKCFALSLFVFMVEYSFYSCNFV
jgi:hypothetical protein